MSTVLYHYFDSALTKYSTLLLFLKATGPIITFYSNLPSHPIKILKNPKIEEFFVALFVAYLSNQKTVLGNVLHGLAFFHISLSTKIYLKH